MKNIAKEINQILAEWDPIDVGKDISSDEYQSYVPRMMKDMERKEILTCCLIDILNNSLEMGYDDNNAEHKTDLASIVERILNLKEQNF